MGKKIVDDKKPVVKKVEVKKKTCCKKVEKKTCCKKG